MDLGGLVDHLVHDDRQEVAEHDVDDRPHAGHRRADADAAEPGLRNRRIDDAVLAEFVDQPHQHLERRPRFRDVFAHEDDARVAAHFLSDRFLDRVAKGQLADGGRCIKHKRPPSRASDPDTERQSPTPSRRPSL